MSLISTQVFAFNAAEAKRLTYTNQYKAIYDDIKRSAKEGRCQVVIYFGDTITEKVKEHLKKEGFKFFETKSGSEIISWCD